MFRSFTLLLALATPSFAALAQSTSPAGQQGYATAQMQAAPIVHAYAAGSDAAGSAGQQTSHVAMPKSSQPIAGVMLRSDVGASLQTVSAGAQGTEIRIEHGRANISVRNPAENSQILVDLPGGQISLVKNGLYTFNADTNTVRVIDGEAEAYPGADTRGIKVKGDQQLVLNAAGKGLRPVDAGRNQLFADLLPGGAAGEPRGEGYAAYPGRMYGYGGPYYGPYGDGFYGAPLAYGYGYPFGFGYPYGYGFGLGFGYFGGFRGGYGGFRGRFR